MISTSEYNRRIGNILGPLNKKIRKLKAVISGSFVSSVILDEKYYDDIDIYLLKYNKEFNEWIVGTMGGIFHQTPSYFGVGKYNYKFICTNKIINIIIVNVSTVEEIKEYIKSTSDLDICTASYDGYKTEFPPCLLIKQAQSINEHLISNFDLSETHNPSYNRFWQISFINYMDNFFRKRKIRIVKYQKRGFKITTKLEITENDIRNYESFCKKEERIRKEIVQNFIRLAIDATNGKYIRHPVMKRGIMGGFYDYNTMIDEHKSPTGNLSWVNSWVEINNS